MKNLLTKSNLFLLLVLFVLSTCATSKKLRYNNSPVINAKTDYSEYRIGEDWYKGSWSIAPQVAHDTLEVICYGPKESFEFKTDMDAISFDVKANTSTSFYVKMDENTYAHTVITGVPFQTNTIRFDDSRNTDLQVKYQLEKSDYLEELQEQFPLPFLKEKKNDQEVVLAVLNWTRNRWEHDGNNSPSKNDAITILKEVEAGQRFPCFAYAIVLRDQLTALGYKARTVYLKTQDAAYSKRPPGHVATEVFLNDLQKWVFIDGQFDVMPTLNGVPLNAVEFQAAINNNYEDFKLESLSSNLTSKNNYVRFVYDYLYYFDTAFDNRYDGTKAHTIKGKDNMMLVPEGAENLTRIAFWDSAVDYCIYTNSVEDFYAKPE